MTIMSAWDCLKHGNLYFSEKGYLKSVTEISFSTERRRTWWFSIKSKVASQQFFLPLVNPMKRYWKHYTEFSHVVHINVLFVISMDLLFDQFYRFFSHCYRIIPVFHNEDFEMHNDIHHINISIWCITTAKFYIFWNYSLAFST